MAASLGEGVFSFGESEGGGGVFRAVTDSGGHYTSRLVLVLPPTAMPAQTLKLSPKVGTLKSIFIVVFFILLHLIPWPMASGHWSLKVK